MQLIIAVASKKLGSNANWHFAISEWDESNETRIDWCNWSVGGFLVLSNALDLTCQMPLEPVQRRIDHNQRSRFLTIVPSLQSNYVHLGEAI